MTLEEWTFIDKAFIVHVPFYQLYPIFLEIKIETILKTYLISTKNNGDYILTTLNYSNQTNCGDPLVYSIYDT